MDPFKTQQTIRNNASELSDYLSDLKSWNSDMNKKEQQSKHKNQNKPSKNNDNLPPIRNQIKATSQLKKNEEVSLKFKTEGNNYFKANKYNLALESYSKAIKSNPLNAILYSNRALTKLKLNNFKSAETDCNKCIELDSTQIKAYFRRGLARKSLKKYNKALNDFETALKLDPNNKAAKKEKIEMKNKLQIMYKKSKQKIFEKNVSKNTNNIIKKNDKMRKIIIEECDDSDSDSSMDSKQEIKTEKINVEKKENILNKNDLNVDKMDEIFEMDKIPNNFIEFEKMWNRAKINKNRALILLKLKNKRLDKIIKNMMDDKLFSQIIQCVHYIGMNKDICDTLVILKQLIKLDRFEMIVMFMDENDEKLLKEVKQKCVKQKLNVAVFDKFE